LHSGWEGRYTSGHPTSQAGAARGAAPTVNEREQSQIMPKLKTHKGASKRFKRTASGKFLRGSAFKRHILTSKTTKRKRGLRGTVLVSAQDQGKLELMLPYK
jgi:large subunit ribosomal protein L35